MDRNIMYLIIHQKYTLAAQFPILNMLAVNRI
jgi:hypothetical protein